MSQPDQRYSIPHELAWILAGVMAGGFVGAWTAAYSFTRAARRVFGKDPEVISRG